VAAAWAMFLVAIALLAADAVLGYLARDQTGASSSWNLGLVVGLIFGATLLAFPIIGLVLALRVHANPIGWLLLMIALCWAVALGTTYADYGLLSHPGAVPAAATVGDITSTFWIPSIGLMGTFLFLLFPTGRLLTSRWRWVARLSGVTIVVTTIGAIVSPGDMGDVGYKGYDNPLGIEALSGVLHLVGVALALLPVCLLLSAVSLVLRYRRSVGIERQQMKWLAGAAGGVAVIWGAVMVISLVTSLVSDTTPTWVSNLQTASLLSFVLVPVAIGFAVLRYRLYEIDVIVRRTLVYTLLVAMLAVIYLGGIALLGVASRRLTGQSSALAVTLSTLLVAAAFQPLRRRTQHAVEHRFYRRRYDTDLILQGFSSRLREHIELDALSHELAATVHATVQPRSVSIWLR
jgi:hypothetical protein